MSEVGHFQTSARMNGTSVLRPTPDIRRACGRVRYVPQAVIRYGPTGDIEPSNIQHASAQKEKPP
jgi:hypothetical protein